MVSVFDYSGLDQQGPEVPGRSYECRWLSASNIQVVVLWKEFGMDQGFNMDNLSGSHGWFM